MAASGPCAAVLAVAGEDVGGDGGDFESDEDDQQLDGAGEQAHAHGAEDDEREVFALVVAVFRQSIEREQEGDQDDAADEDVEEDSEGAGFDGAEEAVPVRKAELPEASPQGDGGADGGDPTEWPPREAGGQRRHRSA